MTGGVRNLLALLLVALGLVRILGFCVGSDALMHFGRSSMAAPLPLVFSSWRGVDVTTRRFRLELVTESGERVSITSAPGFSEGLAGPFKRVKPYVIQLLFARRSLMAQSILRYGLCGEGPLARHLGAREPVTRLTVTAYRVQPPAEPLARLTLDCAR